MSIEHLRKLDKYRFFARTLQGEELQLSSMPFFAKASGTHFELSMLRDVDFCFKYKPGTQMRFAIYAVRFTSGDKQRDSLYKLYTQLKKDNGSLGDNIYNVYNWSHVFGESELKSLNRENITVSSDFKIHWWVKFINGGRYWMFTNPEIRISTSVLISKICSPVILEQSSSVSH